MADTIVVDGEVSLTSVVDGVAGTVFQIGEEPQIESLTVTENGTYTADGDGYNPVTVAVPATEPDIEALSITENGTYTAEDCDGYSPITVNVETGITPTGTISITENGTVDVTQYASAEVNVESAVQIATGTFVGDGTTNTLELELGFAPDVVIVTSDLDLDEAGWRGPARIVIVRNAIAIFYGHNSTTATSAYNAQTYKLGGSYAEYGSASGYIPYGTYSNGVFTLTEAISNYITRFVADATYTWTAIKYT